MARSLGLGPAADLLAGHGRPGPAGHPRRQPARRARDPGRVRRVRDPALPDLHHRDLHRVPQLPDLDGRAALSLVLVVLEPGRAHRRGRVAWRRPGRRGPPRWRPGRRSATRSAGPPRSRSPAARRWWPSPSASRSARSSRCMTKAGGASLPGAASVGCALAAHRRLQRAGRAHRDGRRAAGRRAVAPAPEPTGRALREELVPHPRAARDRGRAGARLLHRALRVRHPLREPGAPHRRLLAHVLPARPGGGAGLAGPVAGRASRRWPARSARPRLEVLRAG